MLTCMKHKITRIDHINIKHRDFMWIVVHFAWNDMHTLGRVHGKSFMTLNSGITRLQCHWSWQKNALCIAWNHLISSHCIASFHITHKKDSSFFCIMNTIAFYFMDVCMFFSSANNSIAWEKHSRLHAWDLVYTRQKWNVCLHP